MLLSGKSMSEMDVAFLLVLYSRFCYNKGNEFTKETYIMTEYMHLLVGHSTQKSKKLEVCYTLDDTTYVRPKRLKEDTKVAFMDWPDTVLGRLQRAYDRVPLKQDRDNVLTDYRKLVACLKDAFIVLTDGSYESSELFEETCSDSDLRRVFLAALELFNVSVVLSLKTDDVWKLLEDLEVSVNFDKAIFNRLQDRYVDKGFSVFNLPETLLGHDYGTIREGSEIYKQLLFDLIHPFDALFLMNTALTTLAKIEQGVFESEMIDGQLLNVLGDWLRYLDTVVGQQITVHEHSKDERVRSYKTMFEKFQAHRGLSDVSLQLFTDVKLSSVSLEDVKESLLNPLARAKDRAMVDSIVDSLSSEIDVMPLERKMSSIDRSLVDLATATSELVSDVVELSESVDSEVVELSAISTSEEHCLDSYSEALPEIMSEPIGIFEDIVADVKPTLSTTDNNEFRELPSRKQLETYAEEKSVPLFNLEPKEDTIKPSCLDVPKKDTFYVESSNVLPMETSKKDTFYVEPSPEADYDVPASDTTVTKNYTIYMEPMRKKGTVDSPFFYSWRDRSITDSDIVVTDKKPGFYTTGLEMALDRLPPKDVLKNVYVDYSSLRAAVQLCLLQDVFDVRVMINELMMVFDAIGRGDYANDDVLRGEKIKFLRSGLVRCLLEIKGNVVSPLWDNQIDDQFGFDVKTVQHVLTNLIKIYGRNEGTIEHWFSVSDDIKRLVKHALSYVSDDTMFVKVPVSFKHTEFSDWLSDKECDALSQLLFFDAKKTDWYRSKAIEKDLMEQYKDCSLLPLDFLKDDTVTNPSRYRKNAIEAWDFTIQSLLPHPLATVAEYVIRYPYKGGREDLEKALAWAKKAEQSLPYLQATVGYGDGIVDELPKVTKELFPDCSDGQRDVLRAVQKATLALRGSLGYGDPEDALREVTVKVTKLLDEM